MSEQRARDREIIRLAFPAFLALVAEPVFLLTDSAIIGHVGTEELAGLGVAGAILTSLISLCVFLAYGTTASVARRLGAGDLPGAISGGIQGVWLAVGLGAVATVVGVGGASTMIGWFDPGEAVAGHAQTYLQIAALGAIPMLAMLAATGILRGLQDTRTPMFVAIAGNLINIVLNLVLVHGLNLGIAGSAIGTLVAQAASAAAMLWVVARAAAEHEVEVRPCWSGIVAAGRTGFALFLRTVSLRINLLVMVWAATRLGPEELAANQVALTLWTFLAFTLDAIAIAAQALTGRQLGAGNADDALAVARRMQQWGLMAGVVTGLGLAAVAPFIGGWFTPDPVVQDLLTGALLVAALAQPLAGLVFVLDGILIGAGDGVYLAWAGLAVLAVFAPAAWLAVSYGSTLVWLWVAFGGAFMGSRALVLLARARGQRWIALGAALP